MSIYNINDYGAHPNSAEPSTEAIARAIHAASEAGEEQFMFLPGTIRQALSS